MMESSRYEQAFEYAIHSLQQDLLQEFLYHNANHTLNEVVPACERLAEMEGVQDPQRQLLVTAAYFHDLGLTAIKSLDLASFQAVRSVHEEKGAEIARSVLPGYGFDETELELICSLILATKWAYEPKSILEQIIRDADLSSIGQDTAYYQKTSNAIRQEFANFGREISEIEWLEYQNDLLESHTFHTSSARNLYSANMGQNLLANKARLGVIQDAGNLR